MLTFRIFSSFLQALSCLKSGTFTSNRSADSMSDAISSSFSAVARSASSILSYGFSELYQNGAVLKCRNHIVIGKIPVFPNTLSSVCAQKFRSVRRIFWNARGSPKEGGEHFNHLREISCERWIYACASSWKVACVEGNVFEFIKIWDWRIPSFCKDNWICSASHQSLSKIPLIRD